MFDLNTVENLLRWPLHTLQLIPVGPVVAIIMFAT